MHTNTHNQRSSSVLVCPFDGHCATLQDETLNLVHVILELDIVVIPANIQNCHF